MNQACSVKGLCIALLPTAAFDLVLSLIRPPYFTPYFFWAASQWVFHVSVICERVLLPVMAASEPVGLVDFCAKTNAKIPIKGLLTEFVK
jgi:hypothetical protein